MTKYLYLPNVSDKLPFGERLRALRTRVAFGMIGIAGEIMIMIMMIIMVITRHIIMSLGDSGCEHQD